MSYNLIVFGTRPELIKLIPIIIEIRKRKLSHKYKLLFTNQHAELVKDLFEIFQIEPDAILEIDNHHLGISDSLSKILLALQKYIEINKSAIEYVIAQGDTSSCLGAAMMAYLHQLKFAHIEAGLRTFDLENPFPEEYFRRIISLSADVHFAPTELAKQNLLAERIQKEKIILTGNTIVDAIEMYKNMDYTLENEHLKPLINKANHVLISCHRRENQNDNFDSLMLTVQELAGANPRLSFIWLSHLNPFVSSRIKNKALNSIPNIHVIEPISFLEMIGLYKECKLIITDSGGIQEEAVTFGIPTIVIREKTERLEVVELGNAVVVGHSKEKLIIAFNKLIGQEKTIKTNPFGDGKAARRIIDFFEN